MKPPFPIDRLKIGDVCVVYSNRLQGRLIAHLTERGVGKWSHVGVVVSCYPAISSHTPGPYMLEATKNGVVLTNWDDFLEPQVNLAISRCDQKKHPISLDRLNRDAHGYIGTPYAWKQLFWDLVALMWKGGGGREVIRQFRRDPAGVTCTELVGKLYEAQGVKVKSLEQDGVYIPPPYLAPNEYIDSMALPLIYLQVGNKVIQEFVG